MMGRLVARLRGRTEDLIFVGLLALCVVLGAGAVRSGLETREMPITAGGARKVDLKTVRKQISEGELSSQKAVFFKKLPR
ncbi:MAG: hypothetical protein FJ118_01005 [Deltaproteobacteria bacterium]|nr:hypothetical protein [Deltaproteobacteria bacterium]